MPGIIINKLTEDEAKKDIEGAIDRAMEVLASLLDAAGSVFAQLEAPAKDVYNCVVGGGTVCSQAVRERGVDHVRSRRPSFASKRILHELRLETVRRADGAR